MNRPTESDEILAMPDAERYAYAAEVCMGLKSKVKVATHEYMPTDEVWFYDYLGWLMPVSDYQPSQPTGKGKAQCWDLAENYDCFPVKQIPSGEWASNYAGSGADFDKIIDSLVCSVNPQAAVVTAAILCALAEKGN